MNVPFSKIIYFGSASKWVVSFHEKSIPVIKFTEEDLVFNEELAAEITKESGILAVPQNGRTILLLGKVVKPNPVRTKMLLMPEAPGNKEVLPNLATEASIFLDTHARAK